MMYVLGLLVAAQLVIGQALWKVGVQGLNMELSVDYFRSGRVWHLLTSPYLIGGSIVYIVATLLYLFMLAKYPYSTVQGLVVPIALIIAFAIARWVFHEHLSATNIAGLFVLVAGILLVTRR